MKREKKTKQFCNECEENDKRKLAYGGERVADSMMIVGLTD